MQLAIVVFSERDMLETWHGVHVHVYRMAKYFIFVRADVAKDFDIQFLQQKRKKGKAEFWNLSSGKKILDVAVTIFPKLVFRCFTLRVLPTNHISITTDHPYASWEDLQIFHLLMWLEIKFAMWGNAWMWIFKYQCTICE